MRENNLTSEVADVAESMRSQLRQFTAKFMPDTAVGSADKVGLAQGKTPSFVVGVSTAARIFATELSYPINAISAGNASIGTPEYIYSLERINTDELNESANEMLSYLNLKEGWDGPRSIPPSKTAVADAYTFIHRLFLKNEVPEPTVYGDGQVGWYWSKGNDVISMVFTGGGRYAYFGTVGGKEVRSPSREYGDAIPHDLTVAINNI